MMTMTRHQAAEVLGWIAWGLSVESACREANVSDSELLAELDKDAPYRFGYLSVTAVRDALTRELSRALEDGTK